VVSEPAISVSGLVKAFGKVRALQGVDFQAAPGTVLGLLGPNGAGKTTAVRVMTTLLRPDAGSVRVAGLDVVRDAVKLRQQIGLAGQYAAVDENLTGMENLVMVGRLYGEVRAAARQRGQELLERFDLLDAAKRALKTYSGGMRRRLDLAAALVARPPVLFLDEPTTGLDPRSRVALWETIEELVADGTTVLLTTQHLDEADHAGMQRLVADLCHTYQRIPALWQLDGSSEGFRWIDAGNVDQSVVSFVRMDTSGHPGVACIANFSSGLYTGFRIGLPAPGVWREVINTDAASYGGSGQGNMGQVETEPTSWHGFEQSALVTVPPLGVVWLSPAE